MLSVSLHRCVKCAAIVVHHFVLLEQIDFAMSKLTAVWYPQERRVPI